MRLTHVAQMALPPGRLSSYAPEVLGGPGEELRVSFDQGRHVSMGQRTGSWMALAAELPERTTRAALASAWDRVVDRHAELRTIFVLDDGLPALHAIRVGPGTWEDHEIPEGLQTRDALRRLLDVRCRPLARPSHLLCLLEPDDDSAANTVVVSSDHAHVDMWSMALLLRDLVLHLGGPDVELPPAPAFAEHTAQLARMGLAPEAVRARWAELLALGDGRMPAFPMDLGQLVPAPEEIVEVRDVLDARQTERLSDRAREEGVRMIALAMSVLTDVTSRLTGEPLRAVFPVHSRSEPRWHESVGWFITNAVVECVDAAPGACAAAVEEAIELGSWPVAPILAPYGGMRQRPGMFAVSWLDSRRLPVPSDADLAVQYVSAAMRTDGVMLWFFVNRDGLHLRCRYPDTPEARTNVGRWLGEVERGLHTLAG